MATEIKYRAIPTERIIALIYSKPEIWDYSHPSYANKKLKAVSWKEIAEELHVSVSEAKFRWTNLRDFFRRLMKKMVTAAEKTGDPAAYVPQWKHFKNMLFLKEQVLKSLKCDLQVVDEFNDFYQEDGNNENDAEFDDIGNQTEGDNSDSSLQQMLQSDAENMTVAIKREQDADFYDSHSRPSKRPRSALGDVSHDLETVDSDYHFLLSILPSVRSIRRNRKIHFRMKVMQLLLEEEDCLE